MSVKVAHLHKSYGRIAAVTDLSFTVDAGSVFAFLGANGAGKSTTIGCITTTLALTAGQIEVNGYDVAKDAHEVRRSIGAVFQSSLLDPLLTVRENLAVRAGFYGLGKRHAAARIDDLSDLVGLSSFLTRRYGQLSGGQKRRTDIARALIHAPAVVFLDEPTAGLDPQSRDQIWKTIQELRASSGTTVFLTTHYMEETERADRVCIIDRGEIVAQGTPAELRARYSSSILTVRSSRPAAVLDRLAELGFGSGPRVDGEDIIVPVDSSAQARTILAEVDVDDFEFRHGTMDDVFLAVTREVAA